MKGQYLTIEYVLFFAIGIAMTVAVYMMFTNINVILKEDAQTMQFEKIGSYVRDATLTIYETGKRTNSVIEYNLEIPPKLSNSAYVISFDARKKINVNSTQNSKIGAVLDIYNINIQVPNTIYSTNGAVKIQYQAGGVVLS